ncbi:hypothetical protein EWM64_g4702 [Hericium alpestre]|uniref:F-box domain-containing protein n=1 Tax=Hericium alpestre TaxID=135208 RepID=A0A4Y9ZWP2_9AGAM|nr:hypothetical protein EWM64_g4702 [Hericium alpestre]
MTIPISKRVKADVVLKISQGHEATKLELKAIPTGERGERVKHRVHSDGHAVHRVPLEVLCEIFTYHAATYRPSEEDCRTIPRTLLSITHVCHRWREAAINYSLLWTHVSLASDEWAALTMKRSRKLPLVAFGDIPVDRFTAVDFSVPHLRVQRLEVGCSLKDGSTEGQDVIITLPREAAPNLQAMHVWARPGVTGTIIGKPFDGTMPVLDYLKLERLSFDWAWVKSVSSLTRLVVQNTPRPPTLPKLLAALRELQNLEILVLESTLPRPQNENVLDDSSDLPVILPRLKLLWIRDGMPSVNNIYQYFELRPKTAVNVYTRFDSGDDVPLTLLLTQLLARPFADGRPLYAHLETLVVDHWSPDQVSVRAGLHTVDVSEPHDTLRIPLGDAARFPTSLHMECEDLAALHAALPKVMQTVGMELNTTGLAYKTALVRTLYPELFPGLHFLNHASQSLTKLVLVSGAAGVFAPSFGPCIACARTPTRGR